MRWLWFSCYFLLSRLSESFLLPSVSTRRYPLTPTDSPRNRPCPLLPAPISTTTSLHASKNSTDTDLELNFDGSVLTGDVLAIIVACQLIGLIDVLTDSSFWDQGGFAQSIPAMPSTLGTFVQRVSSSCICWIVASLGLSNIKNKKDGSIVAGAAVTVANTAQLVAVFVALQLVLSIIAIGGVSSLANGNLGPLVSVARDCYIITIVVTGWRYFYKTIL